MSSFQPTNNAPLVTLINSYAASNWHPEVDAAVTLEGGSGAAYCWDPVGQRWLGSAFSPSQSTIYFTKDGGQTWVYINSSSQQLFNGTIACMAASYSTGNIIMVGAGGVVASVNGLAGTISSTTTYSATPVDFAAIDNFQAGGYGFQVFGYNGSSGYWLQLNDSSSPTGGHNNTSNLPSEFQTIAGNPGSNVYVASSAPYMRTPSDAIECVVFGGDTAGTDTPIMMQVNAQGVASAVTLPTIEFGTPYVITGLAYSPTDNLWGILCATVSLGTFLCVSSNLVTWKIAHSFATTAANQGGLATIGSIWVTYTLYDSDFTNQEMNSRLLWSPSVGWLANTTNAPSLRSAWFGGDLYLQGATYNDGPLCQLISNGAQLLAGNWEYVAISQRVGPTQPGFFAY